MNNLMALSQLIKQRNTIEKQIASIINRPGMIGHIGEFIASTVFDITLAETANSKGVDGYYNKGPLAGKTVNIKWYTKDQRMLDITPLSLPDYYLVFAGHEDRLLGSSKGKVAPWVIQKVYLFNSEELMSSLKARGVKIGVATSIVKQFWESGEIYPTTKNNKYIISEQEREILGHFREVEDVV